MNALAKQDEIPAGQVVVTDASAMIAMIERAARDPNVDIDKMERLWSMKERMDASRAKAAFDSALSEMQPKLPVVHKNGKITIKDKNDAEKVIQSTPYGLFEDINIAVIPILAEHGFAISFRTSADGKVKVTAILSHREGHREETSLELMHDSTGSKNSVQAIGSSVSYGKRYTMCAILNITIKGEDDDAKKAGEVPISEEQEKEINDLILDTKTDVRKFLQYIGAQAIYEIPASHFNKAKRALEGKKVQK